MAFENPQQFNLLEEGLTPDSIFDYDVRVNQYTYPLEAYFRKREVPGKYYDFTQNENTQVMVARYHPLNAPTDLISREKVAVSRAKLANAKIEMGLDEDDILNFSQPRNDAEFRYAQENLYDDSSSTVTSIREKHEAQRAEILFTGKLKVNENKYVADYDFGIPKSNFKTLKWLTGQKEEGFNIFNDISDIQDMLMNNGQNVPAAYILAPSKIINLCLLDPTIRSEIATLNPNMRISRDELNTWLRSHDLPIFVPYNRLMTFPDETMSIGTQKRLLPDNKMVFIPDGYLGDFVTGTTPEQLNADETVPTSTQDGITLQVLKKHDPEGQFVKASSRFFTTLAVPKQIVNVTLN